MKKITIYKEVSNCTECPFYFNGSGFGEPYCERAFEIDDGEITSEYCVPSECPFRKSKGD